MYVKSEAFMFRHLYWLFFNFYVLFILLSLKNFDFGIILFLIVLFDLS